MFRICFQVNSTIDSPFLLTRIFGTYELKIIEFSDSGVPFLKILASFLKTFSRMFNESSQKLPFVCTKRFVTIHLLVSQLKFSLWHGQFGQKGKTKDWNMSQIRPLGNCGSWSRRPKECFWRIRAQYHPSQSDFVKKIKSNGCQRIIWPLYQRYLVLLTQDDSDWLRRLSNQSPFKRKIKFYFLFV